MKSTHGSLNTQTHTHKHTHAHIWAELAVNAEKCEAFETNKQMSRNPLLITIFVVSSKIDTEW